MRRPLPLTAFFAILLLCGCIQTSTVTWTAPDPGQKSSSGKPVVWNLKGYNCGLFLFNLIPIWSGDAYGPNRRDFELFEDHVDYWHMRRQLDYLLHQLKADAVEDIQIQTNSTGAFTLWIFWRRTIHATGVAVKNKR